MKASKKPISISVFKSTKDDWYPSFKIEGDARYDDLVSVSYLELVPSGEWRVCVWGADDMGVELDFLPHERIKAWDVFISIIEKEYVEYSFLKSIGFYSA